MVDEQLWKQCQRLMADTRKPSRTNVFVGTIGEDDVYLSNFDWYMLPENADMPDVHEGFNSVEDPRVEPPGLHVDYQMSPHNWPFILYHEALEVRNMRKFMGQGMTRDKAYDKAHELSNKDEMALRKRMKVGTEG